MMRLRRPRGNLVKRNLAGGSPGYSFPSASGQEVWKHLVDGRVVTAPGVGPVAMVWLPRDGQVIAKIPARKGNRRWLHEYVRIRSPRLVGDRWYLPRNCLSRLVIGAVDRYGYVKVWRDMSRLSRCTRSCLEATGIECDCSCLGEYHGSEDSGGWIERVGDVMVADLGEITRTANVYRAKGDEADAVVYGGELRGRRYRVDRAGRQAAEFGLRAATTMLDHVVVTALRGAERVAKAHSAALVMDGGFRRPLVWRWHLVTRPAGGEPAVGLVSLGRNRKRDVMHVARVRMHRFRGYAEQVVMPAQHAVVVGEPRAGRSDLITGLRRALDPRSWSRTPDPADLHRLAPGMEEEAPDEETVVEVTLLGLGADLEQDLNDRLELIDSTTGLPAAEEQATDGELGVRMRYRIYFDEVPADYSHAWEYARTGTPIPRLERDLLAAVVIGPGTPLQLRSGGVFRGMVTEQDADAVRAAIEGLAGDVSAATGKLAEVKAVQEVLARILDGGAANVLGVPAPEPSSRVGFVADDGSIDALLRRLQPTLALDDAGPLPLSAHGSTTKGVLAVAEAMTAANIAGAVVLADDFGDDLDAASGEFLAAALRRASGQVWLSTRRPEVVRAFDSTEVLRLTRSHGERRHHQLAATTDKKARLARRQLHQLLLPAMTTRSVALQEGPHDLESYTAVAERRLTDDEVMPPAAYGVRMIAAGISGGGGKEQLPKLADLARKLGFHVRVVIDNDKPGSDAKLLAELDGLAEQIIRLPERTAVERALVRGLPPEAQRAALSAVNDLYGLGLNVDDIADADLEETIVKQLKHKNGLHQPFVAALPDGAIPPLAAEVLDTLTQPPGQQILTELQNP